MKYDPIKRSLGSVFNTTPFLRIFFYRLLDLLLLRSWHIRRELRALKKEGFKPEKIADKIVEGKLQKYFKENCLMDQAYVRNPEMTIADLLNELIAKISENIFI